MVIYWLKKKKKYFLSTAQRKLVNQVSKEWLSNSFAILKPNAKTFYFIELTKLIFWDKIGGKGNFATTNLILW